MAPKTNTGKDKASEEEEEEVLQAIVLADSFDKRFQPLTVNTPRCLLPVCNVALLDWTFESLASAGVQEIYVVCRSHSEQVKDAIQNSKWSKPSSGVKIRHVVTTKQASSVGDAIRDIYTYQLITSDFILVHGDLVSNVPIDEVMRIHKERRKKNKNAIMTMIVKESGALHRTRARGETSVFVLDSNTSECVHYEPVSGRPVQPLLSIPREVLKEHPEVEIRNDLVDCGIDVCAFEVLSLFQDNFDYQEIRRGFVHGVVTSDILMKNIHCHIVSNGYAARVKDTKSYAAVSKDILARWTFPLVPDDNLPGSSAGYEHLRGNNYFSRLSPPQLARTAEVGPLTLLGPGVTIAPDARVQRSVLGPRCVIGAGVVISDSYLWEGTVVESGSVIEESVLGKRVRVKARSKIAKGCLVGEGVVLGPEARLPAYTRVSSSMAETATSNRPALNSELDQDDDEELLEKLEAAQTEELQSCLGSESNGLVWPSLGDLEDDESDDEDDEDRLDAIANQRLLRLGDNASDISLSDAGSITSESESESESSSFAPRRRRRSSASSASSALHPVPSSSLKNLTSSADAKAAFFLTEASASLARAFAEGHALEDAAMEVKAFRMASDVPLRLLRMAVVGAIVDHIKVERTAQAQRAEIARVMGQWGALIVKIGGMDGKDTVSILQEHCAKSPARLNLFGQILAALYQDDIVEEDDIRAWHESPQSKGGSANQAAENMRKCWAVGSRMIEQFDDQEDESDCE